LTELEDTHRRRLQEEHIAQSGSIDKIQVSCPSCEIEQLALFSLVTIVISWIVAMYYDFFIGFSVELVLGLAVLLRGLKRLQYYSTKNGIKYVEYLMTAAAVTGGFAAFDVQSQYYEAELQLIEQKNNRF
jgi:hypothetical protein